MKKVFAAIVVIVLACALAFAAKTMLPSDVNIEDFDSVFVRRLGFEVVAAFYLVLIFTHNAVITFVFGRNTVMPNLKIGLRFGICFGLIYLFGMQEVIVEA